MSRNGPFYQYNAFMLRMAMQHVAIDVSTCVATRWNVRIDLIASYHWGLLRCIHASPGMSLKRTVVM